MVQNYHPVTIRCWQMNESEHIFSVNLNFFNKNTVFPMFMLSLVCMRCAYYIKIYIKK